ncbi:MAG: cyclic nucleotide-binding domain-containing protein [Candidatus Hydrogenedens sp.]|nr:cyclic nucleotide-binding domain-containing protein [Candidatus Hydrogenedens sp.]
MPDTFDISSLGLPPESEILAVLARFPHAKALRFSDDELLVRAGHKGEEFYLLIRGTCLVELPPPSPEEHQDKRQPGNELSILHASPEKPVFVGEMACFGDGLRSASVRSSMNTVALRLEPEDLHTMLERFPKLTRALCEQFSERLQDLNDRLRRHRAHLAMRAEQRFIEPGALLFERGKPGDTLYQLVDGAVEIEHEDGTTEVLRPGRGEMSFLDARCYFTGGNHTQTARAKSMVIAVAVAPESREAVVRNFPHLLLRLLGENEG